MGTRRVTRVEKRTLVMTDEELLEALRGAGHHFPEGQELAIFKGKGILTVSWKDYVKKTIEVADRDKASDHEHDMPVRHAPEGPSLMDTLGKDFLEHLEGRKD